MTHSMQTPLFERVYDMYNVSFQGGLMYIQPIDIATTRVLQRHLRYKLHSQSLASQFSPIDIVAKPYKCDGTMARIAFIKPYHTDNLFHLLNENVLPLVTTLFGYGNVTLVTMKDHGNGGHYLPHWKHMLDLLQIRNVVSYESFVRRKTCVGHAIWGLGVKPYWSSQRRFHTHSALLYRRMVFSGLPDVPNEQSLYLARNVKNDRELANPDRFVEETGLLKYHATCPVMAQMAFLRNCRAIVGMHGAGLTNVIYMNHPALLEIHGPHGWDNNYLQRLATGLHGAYVAVYIKNRVANASHVKDALDFVRRVESATLGV